MLVTRTADQEIQPAAVRIATDLFQGLNCCQTLTAFPLPELPRIIFGFKIKLRLAFIRKGNIYVQVSKAVRRFRAMTYHLRLAFAHLGCGGGRRVVD